MYLFFSFLFFLRYIVLVHEVLWSFIDIHCTYFLFYIVDVCFSFTHPFMCCFFSLFIQMFLIICMQSIISVSHKDALKSFVWVHCVKGSVVILFSFEGVVRILCIFSFFFFLRYIVLVHEVLWPFINIHCTYFLFYIDWCMFFFHPPFHVLFLFSLYTHASYYLYAIYYLCFT